MRVNVYAEEMPPRPRVEVIAKTIDGADFTGLRIYLELPATEYMHNGEKLVARQVQGPFMHHEGDDDSSAITFWGKKDVREVFTEALKKLDEHYAKR